MIVSIFCTLSNMYYAEKICHQILQNFKQKSVEVTYETKTSKSFSAFKSKTESMKKLKWQF